MPSNHRDTAITASLIGAVSLAIACTSAPAPVPPREPVAAAPPVPPAPVQLSGARIAAMAGGGALVIDDDSGMLLEVDGAGRAIASLAIGRGAGHLVYDPARQLAFVADRAGDRIVAVRVRGTLALEASWKTPVEPFGVALTPDRATVLVTSIGDRALIAYDARSGAERWRAALSPEPRGIAVAPDGARALISSIGAGALDHVELDGAHRVTQIAFELACDHCSTGDAFARGSGSVTFLDAHRAIAPFQRSVPEALAARRVTVYGAGSVPPVTQHLAFVSFPPATAPQQASAQIVENQPRAIAWDAARDTFHIAGLGSDTLLQLPGLTRSTSAGVESQAANFVLRASARCGPDGLAVTADGTLLVWCAFSRTVLRLAASAPAAPAASEAPADPPRLVEGPPLVASSFTPAEHRGRVLFHVTDPAINRDRALTCSTCHPEGRADGLSWKLANQTLQTPILAGRLAGTHPYKWSGSDATLEASLHRTVGRLGGAGLDDLYASSLVAYLQALPRPRAPTRDPAAIARGKALFDGDGGCRPCHAGPTYSDGQRHKLASTLPEADTPSLIGLAASAPYYHDGSAASLDELLRDGGAVHGMVDASSFDDAQRRDLVAFLESL